MMVEKLIISFSSHKFGLYRVNFNDSNRRRIPKKSADWYRKVVKEKRIVDPE